MGRKYNIQEVIKVRQIMLVQVVKEERGNKGAALTSYLSLAGRYCVLMPNTTRGGGISRKITNPNDRKRLKEMALLQQPFIKDSSINVEELVKQVAGKIGENVRVRRFTRYTLGEGIEVEGPDFAEEVASMTSG